MRDELIKLEQRFLVIGLTAMFLSLVSGFIVYDKARQRGLVSELMKQDFVAVQFRDGEYCESIEDVLKRNWLFDTIDVLYVDVPQGSLRESLSLVKQFSYLTRVIVRYQGNDFAQFRLHRSEIEEWIKSECALVGAALPSVEVLRTWTVAQQVDKGSATSPLESLERPLLNGSFHFQ